VIHFYHVYLGDNWRVIVEEHLSLLRRVEFAGELRVGLVGPPEEREKAKAWLDRRWNWQLAAEADAGFEDVTLHALYETVHQELPAETPILYAHNKGSFHAHAENNAWRRSMNEYLIEFWKTRVIELAIYDVMAWTWLPPGEYDIGNPAPEVIKTPLATGNFWWANAGYLRKLDPPATGLTEHTRIEAELWLGLGDPKVGSEKTGWPSVYMPLRWVPNPVVNGMAQPGGQWVQYE
jgi:hypothetical protein